MHSLFLHESNMKWLSAYTREWLAADLLAGVIVAIMLVPQSMAYALLAGLPPQVGLYASIAPLFLYGLFGTSRTLSVAPVAIDSLLTAAALGTLAAASSADYIGLALLLALLVGGLQLLMGLFRLGFLVNFFSQPVLSGFTTAAAIVIGSSQLKHILGVSLSGSENWLSLVQALIVKLPTANPVTITLSLTVLALLIFFKEVLPRQLAHVVISPSLRAFLARPGPLVVVLLGSIIVWLLRLDSGAGVDVVGTVPPGFPPLTIPDVTWERVQLLLPSAATIALVGYMEAISVGKSLASKRRESIDPDRELIALGIANVGSGFSGGYPVTGGLSRSVVNFSAGAQTGLASLFTAMFIALTTLTLTPYFYFLPHAVLAAIVLVAISTLFDPATFFNLWRYSRADAFAWMITFVVVLLINVQTGIVAGVFISLLLYLYRTSKPHIAVVGRVGSSDIYRNVLRHTVYTCPHVLMVRVDESLYFPNSKYLEESVLRLVAEKPAVEHFVLLGTAINFIDASALTTLEALIHRLRDAGVTFHLAAIKGPVMDRLRRVGFISGLGAGQVFLGAHDAMAALNCVGTVPHEVVRDFVLNGG